MSSQFLSFIAFYPSVEGDTLPAELKAAIINAKDQVDTTCLQEFVPGVAGENWSKDNYCWLELGTVREDRPDYFEIDMDTNFYSAREWLVAVSEAFPSVRIALRGSDDDNNYTEHYVLEGGRYLRNLCENERSVANMNLWISAFPHQGFEATWMERYMDTEYQQIDDAVLRRECRAKVRSVLKAKSASPLLLNEIGSLDLTPKQTELLMAHPNYDPDLASDPNWWLGRTLTAATG